VARPHPRPHRCRADPAVRETWITGLAAAAAARWRWLGKAPWPRPPQSGITRRMGREPAAADKPKPPEKSESGALVLSARAVALELLEAVLKKRKPLDEAFNEHADLGRLVNRDRQFVRALVTCTLRH